MIFNKKNLLFWLPTLLTFVVTRIYNLKVIPIFTDEAIYSYWAQVALHDPQHRYISLEDGKQPLFIWIAAIFEKIFSDPLIALRLVSVLSGFGSLIAIYLLAKNIFNDRIAKLSTILYLFIPFTLLYNRLGLFDSLLTMFGIFALYFTVKLSRKPDLGLALLNGFAIGFAMITKSSGNFFLYLLPFSALLLSKKDFIKKISKLTIYLIWSTILALAIYNSLRLSPLFYLIARKNLEFIRPVSEVLNNPLAHFYSNLNAITGWLMIYLTPPVFIIFCFSVLLVLYKKNLKGIYLLIIICAPLTAELFFNKVLYTRFVLFYLPYILILTAFAADFLLSRLKLQTKLKYILLTFLFVWPTINSLFLLTKPTSAQIPKNDSDQYLNEWPAGYGVEESIKFIKSESANRTVYVATEGTFGLFPYALNIYFYQNPNVQIRAFWPLNSEDLPQQITDLSKKEKTYVIFNQNQKEIRNPKLKLISSYKKGVGDSYMRLYELKN